MVNIFILEFKNRVLTIQQVSDFLSENNKRYVETQKSIKCLARTLPCMCFVREQNCFFIDVFEKLKEKHNNFLDEKYLETELQDLDKIKTETEKVKNWLKKNLQYGLSRLSWFSISSRYADLSLSFINGKNDTEFEYVKVAICGKDFKNNYDFAHLFCDLFFNKEILPDELARWKYENEITK